jgi:hypothetical protein
MNKKSSILLYAILLSLAMTLDLVHSKSLSDNDDPTSFVELKDIIENVDQLATLTEVTKSSFF